MPYKKIVEEIWIEDMDEKSLKTLKQNIIFRLGEYRTYILSNIIYNFETNKVEYREFDSIDIKVIIRELVNEFTEEVVTELNIEAFLRKLNQILELKKRNTKIIKRKHKNTIKKREHKKTIKRKNNNTLNGL